MRYCFQELAKIARSILILFSSSRFSIDDKLFIYPQNVDITKMDNKLEKINQLSIFSTNKKVITPYLFSNIFLINSSSLSFIDCRDFSDFLTLFLFLSLSLYLFLHSSLLL